MFFLTVSSSRLNFGTHSSDAEQIWMMSMPRFQASSSSELNSNLTRMALVDLLNCSTAHVCASIKPRPHKSDSARTS